MNGNPPYHRPLQILLRIVAACLWLAGCGSEDSVAPDLDPASDEAPDPDPDDTDGPEPDGVEPDPEVLLAPPADGDGIQFSMTTEIGPGEEVEHCMFVRSVDETIYVNHDEVRFSEGSHHVLLYTTGYTEIPTENELGTEVDTGGIFDCSEGVPGFWNVTGLASASQNAEGSRSLDYPEGVGVAVAANALLLINAHYINTSEETLEPELYINLYTVPEDELEQEGGLMFWYNPFIKVPAGSSSAIRAGCELGHDVTITTAQSHMHRLGMGYVAELIDPSGSRETIYESEVWEDVPVEIFSPRLEVEEGSRIEWECLYENTTGEAVYQGPRSTDEMCMFIGSYYPRTIQTDFCLGTAQPFFGQSWMIGSGTASCSDSLACMRDVADSTTTTFKFSDTEYTGAIADCMVEADPEVAEPLSNAIRCVAEAPDGMADERCTEQIEVCQGL